MSRAAPGMAKTRRRPLARDMSPDERRQDYIEHRMRYLPGQIRAVEHKLAMLRNEAARYGMTELLEAENE